MELIKSLPHPHGRSLKYQVVQQLFKKIHSKDKVAIRTEKKECEELLRLWELTCQEDEILAFSAYKAVIDLVKTDKLPATYVVQKLVDSFKMCKSQIKCLQAIKEMFIFLIGTKFLVSTSNVGLAHPFNIILTFETDGATLFIPVLKDMFATYGQHSTTLFNLMDPFFKYIFLESKKSHRLMPLRQTTSQYLIRSHLNYLLNILSWMPIEGNECELLEYLDCILINITGDAIGGLFNLILLIFPQFSASIQESITDILLKILRQKPCFVNSNTLMYHCLSNLSNLADTSSTFEILYLILKKGQSKNKFFLSMLVLPLLQFVANSDAKAVYLLELIDGLLAQDSVSCKPHSSNCSPPSTLLFLCSQLSSNDLPAATEQWLMNISKSLDLKKPPSNVILNFVAGVFYGSSSNSEICKSLECLHKLSLSEPLHSIMLFPLLMSKLKKSFNSEICFTILKSIPQNSTHEVSATMALNFLLAGGGLASVGLNLMCSLWSHHDKFFPYLVAALEEMRSTPDEVALVQAKCIRDVCSSSASKHGKEFIGMTFKLLEQRSDRPVRILCMEIIHHLCLEKVLSFSSYWLYFQNNLKPLLQYKSISAAEVRSLLRVFEVIAINPDSTLSLEVASYLWGLTTSNNPTVVNEAFLSLSLFPRDSFLLSQLPQEVTLDQMAKMEEKEVNENLREVIYGDTFVLLLEKFYSKDTKEGIEAFYKMLMMTELTSLPRGIFFKYKEMLKLSFVYQLKMGADHKREVDMKRNKLASNCLHLTANSFLKSCFEFIINFIKHGMIAEKAALFKMILQSLTEEKASCLLPPFNWVFILHPILTDPPEGIDFETVKLCHKLAFQQSVKYPVLGDSLLNLMETHYPLESDSNKEILLENFSYLLSICLASTIEAKFKSFVFPMLKEMKEKEEKKNPYLLECLIKSLCYFITSTEVLKESKNSLWEILPIVVDMVPIQFHKELEKLIQVVPEVEVGRLLGASGDDTKKIFLLRCSLISSNRQPISFINHVLESLVHQDLNTFDKSFAVLLLVRLFHDSFHHSKSSLSRWMVEFMGFIEFTVNQKSSLPKVVDFLLIVWFSSVVKWSSSDLDGLLLFPAEVKYEVIQRLVEETDVQESYLSIPPLVPHSLLCLVVESEWSSVANKILDFLHSVYTFKHLDPIIKKTIKECLRGLRRAENCRKSSFWMKFAELLDFSEMFDEIIH